MSNQKIRLVVNLIVDLHGIETKVIPVKVEMDRVMVEKERS